MNYPVFESLEGRRLLSGVGGVHGLQAESAPEQHLTVEQVNTILGQAGSQSTPTQAVVVSDREGVILGIYGGNGLAGDAMTTEVILLAAQRARTAAFFQSREDAFTTRTARFIIQDHFPFPIRNTPGGPLYGVEFSSLPGSDIIPDGLGISGDPGGIPLFLDGAPIGGIGVAGDGHDVAPREDLKGITQSYRPAGQAATDKAFQGREERDFDEAVALAGAQGFMAPRFIRANRIFVAGLRLPFTKDKAARGNPNRSLAELVGAGSGSLRSFAPGGKTSDSVTASPDAVFPTATIAGVPGQLKRRGGDPAVADPSFGFVSSADSSPDHLTAADVEGIITEAVKRALRTRAAIRKPTGANAVVHIAVVDLNGNTLGVFRMGDGTNFSYDVAVQKARTAAFFSDDAHAFTPRAIGFMSQKFFPAGIQDGGPGPLYQLQDVLSFPLFGQSTENFSVRGGPLRNGITIFPGGAPLYRNGHLVGTIGVSGDGVDQDDIITFSGTKGFEPPATIRSDVLAKDEIRSFIVQRVNAIVSTYDLGPLPLLPFSFPSDGEFITNAQRRLDTKLKEFRLPYVKLPRNPEI